MAGYSRVLEMLDEAMNAAGVLPGLTFVPVRARPTAQGEPETDGKPAPPAGATGDAHGTTSASAGEGGGGGGGSGGRGGNAGSASPPRRPAGRRVGEGWCNKVRTRG